MVTTAKEVSKVKTTSTRRKSNGGVWPKRKSWLSSKSAENQNKRAERLGMWLQCCLCRGGKKGLNISFNAIQRVSCDDSFKIRSFQERYAFV
ncbi:hypothetical protein Hanom_Chr00s175610g01830361 [Helianthus anomalus]